MFVDISDIWYIYKYYGVYIYMKSSLSSNFEKFFIPPRSAANSVGWRHQHLWDCWMSLKNRARSSNPWCLSTNYGYQISCIIIIYHKYHMYHNHISYINHTYLSKVDDRSTFKKFALMQRRHLQWVQLSQLLDLLASGFFSKKTCRKCNMIHVCNMYCRHISYNMMYFKYMYYYIHLYYMLHMLCIWEAS